MHHLLDKGFGYYGCDVCRTRFFVNSTQTLLSPKDPSQTLFCAGAREGLGTRLKDPRPSFTRRGAGCGNETTGILHTAN